MAEFETLSATGQTDSNGAKRCLVRIVCSNQNRQDFQSQQMNLASAGLLSYVRFLSMQFDTQRSHDFEDGRKTRIAFAG